MIKVQIQKRDVPITAILRKHLEQRLGFVLGRFAERIGRVTVRVSTAHGPLNGGHKRCEIAVGLRPRTVRAEDVDADPFAAVDNASDRLVPGGSFERRGPAWTLGAGAYVAPGNEPFYTEGDRGTRSLYLLAGATATSPTSCFDFGDWHARFFVRGAGPKGGRLEVDVVVRSLLGVLTVLDGGSVPANGQWQPSPRIGMLVCNVTSLVGTKAVALRFRAVNAAFQIDDVYIDPWKDF